MAVLNIDDIYNTLRNNSYELTGIEIQGTPVTKIYCEERISFGPGTFTGSRVELDCDREINDVDYTECELSADDDLGTAVNIFLTWKDITAKPLIRIEDNAGFISFVYSNDYTEIYTQIP
jgi:hypothetical protein